jgi:hypothetical protein
MIWLTWRQFRAQTMVTIAALAATAVTLGITGPHLADLFHTEIAGASDKAAATPAPTTRSTRSRPTTGFCSTSSASR